MTEADLLLEKLAVEYRLYTQKFGSAPKMLLLSPALEHRYGAAIFEQFRHEVAPHVEIRVSKYVLDDFMAFITLPSLDNFFRPVLFDMPFSFKPIKTDWSL